MTNSPNQPSLSELYQKLQHRFGYQNWWPGETPDEIVIGAILTQSVAWRNVELAQQNLKKAGITRIEQLYHIPAETIAPLIKPTLYYNQKALKLHSFARVFVEEYAANYEVMFSQPLVLLRTRLLAIKGLGPETVDSILLYAGNLPVFVCDAYTNRLLVRLGYSEVTRSYDYWQAFISSRIPCKIEIYNDFHAQIVVLCKYFCKTKPLCFSCPLNDCCPQATLLLTSSSKVK